MIDISFQDFKPSVDRHVQVSRDRDGVRITLGSCILFREDGGDDWVVKDTSGITGSELTLRDIEDAKQVAFEMDVYINQKMQEAAGEPPQTPAPPGWKWNLIYDGAQGYELVWVLDRDGDEDVYRNRIPQIKDSSERAAFLVLIQEFDRHQSQPDTPQLADPQPQPAIYRRRDVLEGCYYQAYQANEDFCSVFPSDPFPDWLHELFELGRLRLIFDLSDRKSVTLKDNKHGTESSVYVGNWILRRDYDRGTQIMVVTESELARVYEVVRTGG
jgi:hypothetical protein